MRIRLQSMTDFSLIRARERCGVGSYVDRKLAPDPHKLGCVRLELPDPAGVRFLDIDCIAAECVDDFEVLLEHVWVLVIVAVDISRDSARERQVFALSKGDCENIRRSSRSQQDETREKTFGILEHLRRHGW